MEKKELLFKEVVEGVECSLGVDGGDVGGGGGGVLTQLCPILCDAMDCSPPGSYIHGIF